MKETAPTPPPPRSQPIFNPEAPNVHADVRQPPHSPETYQTLLRTVGDLAVAIRAMSGQTPNIVPETGDDTMQPQHVLPENMPRRNRGRKVLVGIVVATIAYFGSNTFLQRGEGKTTSEEIKNLFGNSAGALLVPAAPRPLDGIEAFTTTNTLAASTKWDFSDKDSSKSPFTGVAEKLNSNMLTAQADVQIKWAMRVPYDEKDKSKSAVILEQKKRQLTKPTIDLGKIGLKPLVDMSALTKDQDGQQLNMPPFFRFAIEKKTDDPKEISDIAASKAAAEKLVPILEQSGVLPKPDGINKSGTDLMGEVYRANQMDLVHQIVAAIIGDTVLVDKEAMTQQIKNRLVRLYGLDNQTKYKLPEFTGTTAFQDNLSRLAEEYLSNNHVTAKHVRIVTNEKMPGQEIRATLRTAIDDGPRRQRTVTWTLPTERGAK